MRQKLHLIIDDKCYQEVLKHAFLNKDEIVVTDAHALLIHNTKNLFEQDFIDSIPDGDWLVPKKCLQLMNQQKASYKIEGTQIIVDNKGVKSYHQLIKDDAGSGKFPNYRQVLSSGFSGSLNTIGLNPDLLHSLMLAINPDGAGVSVQFSDDTHAMKVRVISEDFDDYTAMLMPMMVNA